MSKTQEILTIQAGSFANFVGTHWWNMQGSSFCYEPNECTPLDINHDVLFQEGINFQGETTYTPRLLLIDLKRNVRGFDQESFPHGTAVADDSNLLWEGETEVVKTDSIKTPDAEQNASNCVQNDVQHLFEASYTSWSEFLKVHLHPRSFCILNDLTSPEEKCPLETYSSGDEAYVKYGKESIEDTLRKLAEECDYLQGFQIIFDAYNGFSGITNHILQHLNDEYHRSTTLCFPVFQHKDGNAVLDIKEQMHRLYSVLVSLDSLTNYSTLFSPLQLSDDIVNGVASHRRFPYLRYNENVCYHTSAIFAAAVETVTSQFRLKSKKFQMADVCDNMSIYGRKLVASSVCLPFPVGEDSYVSALLDKMNPKYRMTSLTPFFDPGEAQILFQSAVFRGVPRKMLYRSTKSLHYGMTPEELFGEYLNKYCHSSVTTVSTFEEKCSVVAPFPKIFSNEVAAGGFLGRTLRPENKNVDKVPVASSLCNANCASQLVESVLAQAGKSNFKEYAKCVETTFEKDDYEEVLQTLMALSENYQNC